MEELEGFVEIMSETK